MGWLSFSGNVVPAHRSKVALNCLKSSRPLLVKITNPENVVKKLEENQATILRFGVRQLGVFGSYARWEQTQKVLNEPLCSKE